MLKESLVEIYLVAQDCVNFRKDPKIWGADGCYGYPAAILLFSIVDSVGSYVLGGSTRKHFDVLLHKDYYNLKLNKESVDIIYEKYRCILTHNAAMPVNTYLDIGQIGDLVFEIKNDVPLVRLNPFLEVTKKTLIKFISEVDNIVVNSKKLQEILKKL